MSLNLVLVIGCCNLSGGVALIVWFTTNRMCVKNNTIIYVAWASSSKRDCEHDLYCCLLPWCEALRTCRSEQNGAVTRMWRSCWVQPSHQERAIGVVRCKKEVMLLQPLCGVALIVWFTMNGMCMKNNTIIYVVRASNSKRDCEHDLYCCLLPRCEALRTCRSGIPIATWVVFIWWYCNKKQHISARVPARASKEPECYQVSAS